MGDYIVHIIIAIVVVIVFFVLFTRRSNIDNSTDVQNKVNELLAEMLLIIEQTNTYNIGKQYLSLKQKDLILTSFIETQKKLTHRYIRLIKKHETFIKFFELHQQWKRSDHHEIINNAYFKWMLSQEEIDASFSNMNGISLDIQQREIVLTEENALLVVAAAGSGKTMTIAAKVSYLIKYEAANPEKILLITFTDKAARELEERVEKTTGQKIRAYTFHKLGYDLFSKAQGYKSLICPDKFLEATIKQYFQDIVPNDTDAIQRLIQYFAYHMRETIDESDFSSKTEFVDEIKNYDLETLKSKFIEQGSERQTIKGERVKSLAELQIANYLYLHGIEYEYEASYKYNVSDEKHRQYQPDFYLPNADVYIEHYGVDQEGRARWLNSFEEQRYIDSMAWKRQTHQQNHTDCIETFSYMTKQNMLFKHLEEELIKRQIALKPIQDYAIVEKLIERDTYLFEEFQKLICTFISILKESGNTSIKTDHLLIKHAHQNPGSLGRAKMFLDILYPIFKFYQDSLKQRNEIDFSDMINQAIVSLANQQVRCEYDHIIIDEYQDISVSKSKLIQEIIKQTKAKLFAVGDDWQSIFRFAGSDISLFTDFNKSHDFAIIKKIETTYRNPQELVDIASDFVMKNKNQINKSIQAKHALAKPVFMYAQGDDDSLEAIAKIISNIKRIFHAQEILLLGRYSFDLQNAVLLELKRRFYDIKLMFLTVHKAKGLEADHVIILNNRNATLGFPNGIADDPVLSMVLPQQDHYPHAEERRLFYVAVTRARLTCHLLVQSPYSIFVNELLKDATHISTWGVSEKTGLPCPRCDGKLILRTGESYAFYGCSNYPYCEYSAEINIKRDIKCPLYHVTKKDGMRILQALHLHQSNQTATSPFSSLA